MDAQSPNPTPTRLAPRDWIAVDQLVTRFLAAADDEFERSVIRLAAELSGGPDPEVPGGGQAWKDSLTLARENLQTALVEDLDSKQPVVVDDTHPVRAAVTEVFSHADLKDLDRDHLIDLLTELFVEQVQQARESEREVISDWLLARAEAMGRGGSVVVEEQARALGSAAQRLRKTLPDLPDLPDGPLV